MAHMISVVQYSAHSFITATDEGLFGLIPRINAS